MAERHVDSILVVDKDNILKGIATLKDIRKSRENDKKLMLKDVMNSDVVCVNKDKSIVDVLEVMNIKNVGYIPVVDENKNY